MSAANDSFWKPPVLNPGEYDWWKDQFEAHVCSLDEKLWRVFEQGNFPILDMTDPGKPKEKAKDKYTEADYKALQQNARAKKVLYMALSPGDRVKMAVYKTAKEQWDGLARLYEGNEDIKRNSNRMMRMSRNPHSGETHDPRVMFVTYSSRTSTGASKCLTNI